MRALRPFLVPALFGLALLAIAVVVRFGLLARSDPGLPINSAMRQALGQMSLPPADREIVEQRYPDATILPSGLRTVVERAGQGPTPQPGQVATVHYRGRYLDGTTFDDSTARGEGPFNFILGQNRVIPGWEEGVALMSKGEKRTLIVPYWLGYGEKGVRGRIPPKATLVFDIELLDVR